MPTPVLAQVKAFDKSIENKFSFTYSGNQIFKIHVVIKRNSDNVVVYNNTIASMQTYYNLPANSLPTNGISYNISISVFDVNNVESTASYPVLFYCYTQPVFKTNINTNQIIGNSYFDAIITYSQAENELLKEFEFILYDGNQMQIYTTNVLYPAVTTKATISSLVNNNQYYLQATGITTQGTILDTGLVLFSCSYIQPFDFSRVELTNLPEQAMIKIKSNFASVDGFYTGGVSPTYVNGTEIDLSKSGNIVTYPQGFNIGGDFTKEKLFRNPTPYSTILTMNNDSYNIIIRYMLGIFSGVQKCYFLLTATNAITSYRITTSPMAVLTSTQQVYVMVQRINNLFDMTVTIKT